MIDDLELYADLIVSAVLLIGGICYAAFTWLEELEVWALFRSERDYEAIVEEMVEDEKDEADSWRSIGKPVELEGDLNGGGPRIWNKHE